MKKIINGRKYDTETAAVIGSDSYNGSASDFGYWSETLHRKRTGEYFLHGEGGPRSRYARSMDGGGWGWGEEIVPMTVKKAQEWAERHMDTDDYEAAFGPVSEDAADVMISAKIPAAVDAKLRRLAAESQTSVTAILIDLIEKA